MPQYPLGFLSSRICMVGVKFIKTLDHVVLIICTARGSLCLHYFNLEPLLSKHPASWIAHLSLCIFFINYKIPVFNQLSPCILPIQSMHPARMVAYLSQCIFFIKMQNNELYPYILPGRLLNYHNVFFYQMQPARMVAHASCQDGCLCHTALSRSVTGRLGVTRGLRPFITLFVHFPFLLVSPYIFVLVRPFIMLFVHFPFCITCLSFSESVYYAICPFSLSRFNTCHSSRASIFFYHFLSLF